MLPIWLNQIKQGLLDLHDIQLCLNPEKRWIKKEGIQIKFKDLILYSLSGHTGSSMKGICAVNCDAGQKEMD